MGWPLVLLGFAIAAAVEACSGSDDDNGGNGHVDGSADGDTEGTDIVIDYPDGGTESDLTVEEGDGGDGDGEVVDPCEGERAGITNYAALPCNPNNMLISNSKIYGMCPNQVFSCPVTSTDSTTCSTAATMPSTVEIGGENLPVETTKIVDLGNNRLLALYGADGTDTSVSGLMLLDATTHEVVQHVVMRETRIGSGSDEIVLTPRRPTSAVLSSDGTTLYLATSNFYALSGYYEPGTVIALPFASGQIDVGSLDTVNFFFAGRNPEELALIGATWMAVLSSYGPTEMIPFMSRDIDIFEMEPDVALDGVAREFSYIGHVFMDYSVPKGPLPGEHPNPHIGVYDISEPSNAQLDEDRTVDFEDCGWLGSQMLFSSSGDAIVNCAFEPLIYTADINETVSSFTSRDMSGVMDSGIVSIGTTGSEVLVASYGVSSTYRNFFGDGEGVYVGEGPGTMVCNSDFNCYIAVDSACGVTGSSPELVRVHATIANP